MSQTNDISIDDVRQALRSVMDPELGLSVVDLGLVVQVEASPGRLRVGLAQTAPVCPHGESMRREALAALTSSFSSHNPQVDLLPDFPWHSGMMTPEAKAILGW
ncbi:MAG: metal-sulfur cluster assembly factor [Planctomycetota bacterium]